MKKLLIIIGLIGSVHGADSITNWSSLISYCTEETDPSKLTETINGNEITYTSVYTLKTENNEYTINIGLTDYIEDMPASTKLVIPSGITFNAGVERKGYCYLYENCTIENNGILNINLTFLTKGLKII